MSILIDNFSIWNTIKDLVKLISSAASRINVRNWYCKFLYCAPTLDAKERKLLGVAVINTNYKLPLTPIYRFRNKIKSNRIKYILSKNAYKCWIVTKTRTSTGLKIRDRAQILESEIITIFTAITCLQIMHVLTLHCIYATAFKQNYIVLKNICLMVKVWV